MHESLRTKLKDVTAGRTTDPAQVRGIFSEARDALKKLDEVRDPLSSDFSDAQDVWGGDPSRRWTERLETVKPDHIMTALGQKIVDTGVAATKFENEIVTAIIKRFAGLEERITKLEVGSSL